MAYQPITDHAIIRATADPARLTSPGVTYTFTARDPETLSLDSPWLSPDQNPQDNDTIRAAVAWMQPSLTVAPDGFDSALARWVHGNCLSTPDLLHLWVRIQLREGEMTPDEATLRAYAMSYVEFRTRIADAPGWKEHLCPCGRIDVCTED